MGIFGTILGGVCRWSFYSTVLEVPTEWPQDSLLRFRISESLIYVTGINLYFFVFYSHIIKNQYCIKIKLTLNFSASDVILFFK